LASDPVGRKIPEYLRKLAAALTEDKQSIRTEIDQVLEHLEHMKNVIAAQQSYAKVTGVNEVCAIDEIAETALSISEAALRSNRVQVVREFADVPLALLDRHQIVQILVNLISNAKHALEQNDPTNRVLTITIGTEGDHLRVEVRDNGMGIPHENLAKVFNHGFTTKKTGHGFGLHNSANAAQEMDGRLEAHSEGAGTGARFVLSIPIQYADSGAQRAGAA
jgi:C4-dicarboxylate-specific signal transduction histidine kinase